MLSITVNTLIDENDGVGVGGTSLRDAIVAAAPGDTINFAPALTSGGPATILLTHGELFVNKSLTISGPGASLLTIDASGNDPTPTLNGADGSRIFDVDDGGAASFKTVQIVGLTLTGGDAQEAGGGIYNAENLTLSHIRISDNATLYGGGAIYNTGSIVLTDGTISDNFGGYSEGGGIYNYGSLTLVGSTLNGNTVEGNGGGIWSVGTLQLTGSTLKGNTTSFDGGGIYGSAVLTASTISGNTAGRYGGGIFGADGDETLNACTVIGNSAEIGGGISNARNLSISDSLISGNKAVVGAGIRQDNRFSGGTLSLANSTISDNLASGNSAGLDLLAVSSTIRHCTITANAGQDFGGGATVINGMLTLDDTIVAGNSGGDILRSIDAKIAAKFSLIGNNANSGLAEAPIGLPDANGNLIGGPVQGVISPRLGPLGDYGGPTMTHAVLFGSPAINAGDPSSVAGLGTVPAFDQRGGPFLRVYAGRIDIGAYERQFVPSLNLVVDTLVDESDGNYNAGDLSLREAIGLSNGNILPDTITFAEALTTGGPVKIRLTHDELRILDSLTINGPGARWLSIDASGNDPTPSESKGDGSRVFNIYDENSPLLQVVIDGLTLTGGDHFSSGGALLNGENLTIRNCTIVGNAASHGGGIQNDSNIATITVIDSTISGNTALIDGGGIEGANLTILSCTISGNSANFGRAGGIYSTGNLTTRNSTITGNSAKIEGGGLLNTGAASLDHTIVAGNLAGAAIRDDVLTFNVGLSANFSLIGDRRSATIIDLGGNLIGTTASPIVPLLGPLADNGGQTNTHALLAGSPAVDAGDTTAVAGSGTIPQFDQRGAPFGRVFNGDGIGGSRIDIGAFELQPLPSAFFGDYNQNNVVEAADYVLWRNTLGTNVTAYSGADGSGNGLIDAADYDVWRAHFGQSVPPSGSGSESVTAMAPLVTAVPESTVAESALTVFVGKPKQAANQNGPSGEERAASQYERPLSIAAPAWSHVDFFRPVFRKLFGAERTIAESRQDEALMAWLATQPITKKHLEATATTEAWNSEAVCSADEAYVDSVDQLFSRLASN